jgi:hypothetical protein
MNIRLYSNKYDYQMVSQWWRERDMQPLPQHVLRSVGYVAHEGDRDVACAWLYMDYVSGVCWFNLFIANPDAGGNEIRDAHEAIVKSFKHFAEKEGFCIMMAFYEQRSLSKLAQKHGFSVNHPSVAELYMGLTPKEQENVA